MVDHRSYVKEKIMWKSNALEKNMYFATFADVC